MSKALSYFLVFLGIQLLVPAVAGMAINLTSYSDWQQSPYFLVTCMAAGSLVSIAVFLCTGWAAASARYLQSQPWGVLCWCVLAAMGAVIPSVALQEQMPELPNLIEQEMIEIMQAHGGYFVVCLLAPVAEELVFRGAILRALLTWKPARHWSMIAVSALLFALIHMNPAQMPHAFVIGLLLGWLYYRTDSIVPGVAFHWANNTVAYFITILYPDSDVRLIDILGSDRNVGAAVIFSLFILLPALYQLWLRLPKKR